MLVHPAHPCVSGESCHLFGELRERRPPASAQPLDRAGVELGDEAQADDAKSKAHGRLLATRVLPEFLRVVTCGVKVEAESSRTA